MKTLETITAFQFTKVAAEKEESKGVGGAIAAGGMLGAIGASAKGAGDADRKLGGSPSGQTQKEKKAIVRAKETISNNKIKNKTIIKDDTLHGTSIGKKVKRAFGRGHRRRQNANAEATIEGISSREAKRSAEYSKKIKDAASTALKKGGAKAAAIGGVVSGSAMAAKNYYEKNKKDQ